MLALLRERPLTTREICAACPDLARGDVETTVSALRRIKRIVAAGTVPRSEGSTGRAVVTRWAIAEAA